MPIHFIDNYPKNQLSKVITKRTGEPLHGEIWIYKQFLKINDFGLLENENWYLKHDFNLSEHPGSYKSEGQVDFILISKYGVLIIEVKGGGLRVDENDTYYSYNKNSEYQTQNPFIQAKEYTYSIKEYLQSDTFVYRAVILPHETGFKLIGPQLNGYKYLFYSKADFMTYSEYTEQKAITSSFFKFIEELGKKSRKHILNQIYPNWSKEKINEMCFEKYKTLSSKQISRIKTQLFPKQKSLGFNPNVLYNDVIINENYDILVGLERNNFVIIEGGPGTGKTTLALKYVANNFLKGLKGVMFFANTLVKARFEHLLFKEYNIIPEYIDLQTFSEKTSIDNLKNEIDYIIYDESQEHFGKGLFDFHEKIQERYDSPKTMILCDSKQSIYSNSKDLMWYTDFFIDDVGFSHYSFETNHRCIQQPKINYISKLIDQNQWGEIEKQYPETIVTFEEEINFLKNLKEIIEQSFFTHKEKVILVTPEIFNYVNELVLKYFSKDIIHITESNINLNVNKIALTTPIKYRGLENKAVHLITSKINEKIKTQLYIGATRAIESLKIYEWNVKV